MMTENNFVPTTEPIQQMVDKIGATAVFGQPTSENGVTIIPVSQIAYGFGYGGGYGQGRPVEENGDADASTQTMTTDEGGGGGGGAGGRATPCGYIHITADGVKYQPIVDETRIPLAGMLMVAWAIFWIAATIRTIAKAVAKTRQMKIKQASK